MNNMPFSISLPYLSSKVAAVRKNAKLINEAAIMAASRMQPPDLSKTAKLVHEIVKERSDPGKKMMKLGTALLIMPDPITDVAAVPMLILGKALSSNRGTNLSEVYEEVRKSMKLISSSWSLQ